jgi:imidazolonepropionase-like amidohydrolase
MEFLIRKLLMTATLLLPILLAQGQVANVATERKNYEFAKGRWFNGQKFVMKKFYTVGGVLTSNRPDRVDSVIDLSGKYVIPPFGEAHNHNVAQSSRIDAILRMYLEAGIFYVKNPDSLPRATTPLAGKINTPQSIDAVFAGGGLTASGGHPIGLAERQIARGAWSKADGEGAFYFVIDNQADLDRKWPAITAGRPDFIKTYLLYSEEYAKRKQDDAYLDWRGLDPALLPEIVRRAHGAGLHVSTHVETEADFHHALAAGVDEINHLPGFRPEKNDPANYQNLSGYEISEADARLAARNHVVVITTIGDTLEGINQIDERSSRASLAKAVRDLFSANLQLLAKHHVQIAIGSDSYAKTSLPEAISLHGLKIFDNLTLLKMWCEATPQTIFPNRRIGQLRDGYEASFLVLGSDPLQDFMNVKRIHMRIKQGEVLSLSR